MSFSNRSFVDLSAPLAGMPILAIGDRLAEPPLLGERRAHREPLATEPFLLVRRAHGAHAQSPAVRIAQTLDVGLPRQPAPLPQRRQKAGAPFEACAAPRRALTPARRRGLTGVLGRVG
jgi:hypothetical protein